MRIGLIADIHGDVAALQRALELLHSATIDRLICAGDLGGRGPDTEATVQLLQAISNEIAFDCVAGNHDHDEEYLAGLEAETAQLLRQLPNSLTITCENTRIFVAHASPWSEFVRILPTTERHVFKRLAREANADVVILGHTHVPLAASIADTWVYNPGSVCGTYSSGTRTCAVLTLPENTFEILNLDDGQPVQISQLRIH